MLPGLDPKFLHNIRRGAVRAFRSENDGTNTAVIVNRYLAAILLFGSSEFLPVFIKMADHIIQIQCGNNAVMIVGRLYNRVAKGIKHFGNAESAGIAADKVRPCLMGENVAQKPAVKMGGEYDHIAFCLSVLIPEFLKVYVKADDGTDSAKIAKKELPFFGSSFLAYGT